MIVTVAAGGWSLPSDIKKCPKDFVIAANYHAALMMHVDIVIHWSEHSPAFLKHSDVQTLDISSTSIRHIGLSGTAAITFAFLLRPSEVWLAGYDMYTGPQPYYHNYAYNPSMIHQSLESRKQRWRRYFSEMLTPEELYKVRIVSGPLKEILEECLNG